ncbi:hypothetical protein ACFLQ2_02240 [archaeon]
MEIKFVVIGAVIVGLLIVLLLPSGEGQAEPINCGDNLTCFVEAAEDCAPAEVTQGTEASSFSMSMAGEKDGMCDMILRIDSVSDATPEMQYYPEDLKASVLAWEGKSMDCLVPMDSEVYNPENLTQYCQGELKTAMLSTAEKMGVFYQELADVNPACVKGEMWDKESLGYTVHGIENSQCHATYFFEVTPVTGEFVIDHYFTYEDQDVLVAYSSAPDTSEDFEGMCKTADKWSHRDAYGMAMVTLATLASDENSTYCHLTVVLQPTSPFLPGANADIYVSGTGDTLLQLETTGGTYLEKYYEPV